MKAVKITERNVDYLATRFVSDPDDKADLLPIGYYIVTKFGEDEMYDVVSEEFYTNVFQETGQTFRNGFVEIEFKL